MKKMFNKIKKNIILFFKNTPRKRLIIYTCILLLCFPVLYYTTTFSRYVIENVYENYLISKDFYFYSDVLNGQTYTVNDWDGESVYVIRADLKNYIDELRWTKEDITYDVEVSCNVVGLSGNVSCSDSTLGQGGTINYNVSGGTNNLLTINIENINNLDFESDDYVNVVINVSSNEPYKQTLTATFKVYVILQDVKYFINDATNQNFFDFFISNYSNSDKTFTLGWDQNLVSIDNTNDFFLSGSPRTTSLGTPPVTYVNGFSVTLKSRKSALIKFYKNNATDNFTCTSSNAGGCVVEIE